MFRMAISDLRSVLKSNLAPTEIYMVRMLIRIHRLTEISNEYNSGVDEKHEYGWTHFISLNCQTKAVECQRTIKGRSIINLQECMCCNRPTETHFS